MDSLILKRVLKEYDYIINTNNTIREAASYFGVSKSTVHKDLHERLLEIDLKKYNDIKKIMKHHIDIRHIRGGEATKKKYQK